MLKFSNVLAFVLVIISAVVLASIFGAGVDAAIPKSHQLTSSYSYRQYLRDANKEAPVDPLEFVKREKIFVNELKEVMTHNAKPGILYRKGINHMSDWTPAEKKRINGAKLAANAAVKRELQKKPYHSFHKAKSSSQIFPKTWDWRTIQPNILTTVKDQGQCGSCWAHASTETLESHYALATGKLFVLSQQQITSCALNPNQCGGTGNCGGSIAELAYQYVIENGGQTQEWEYPYTSYFAVESKCAVPTQSTRVAKFSGYRTVTPNDETAVMDALLNGPLAVNVDASTWNNYESGIYDGCAYTSSSPVIDHVVQLVGYSHDPALNASYYIVRNSWSGSWAEDGYIRLIKHDVPQCGWNYDAQDGTACYNQSSTQWVCGPCGLLFDTSYPIPAV